MEIVVETDDRPGIIAEIGEVFGHARLNIKAAAAFAHGGRGYLHFVVDDAHRALATLKGAGWEVRTTREVLVGSLDDRPGELGRYARRLSGAGGKIAPVYLARERAGERELILPVPD